jgi:response regulator RpfG family c-di-GMP phosphodiesterase
MNHNETINIIAIDDSPADLVYLEHEFKKSSYSINLTSFSRGADALEYLKNDLSEDQSLMPHLFLLDYNMPGMMGTDFLREVRKNKRFSETPAAVMIGSFFEKKAWSEEELNITAYFDKPVDLKDLEEYIAKI